MGPRSYAGVFISQVFVTRGQPANFFLVVDHLSSRLWANSAALIEAVWTDAVPRLQEY